MTETPTTLNRIVDFLTDHDRQCGTRTPLWRCTGTLLGADLGVIIWAYATSTQLWFFGITQPSGAVGRLIATTLICTFYAMVISTVLDLLFDPKHYTCDQCKRCSKQLGVPAVRNPFRARQLLREHGWWVGRRDQHLCPDHAEPVTEG
jgi:hypothetical protein